MYSVGPKTLNGTPKNQQVAESLTFMESYKKDHSLLDQIVTGDKTWVKHIYSVNGTQTAVYGVEAHKLP